MDTPSKERLVGAMIFVVLIVLLVPEILSGPHHVASTPAAGSTANSLTRTYTIDLGNPVKPTLATAAHTKPPPLPPPQVVTPSPAESSVPTSTQSASITVPGAPTSASAPTASTAAPANPASNKESWGAQLGSFSKAENAERLAATLRAKGYRAFVSPIGAGSHVLHRVRVGPEPTRDAAQTLITRLKRDGANASVVTIP
jgi:DedD protein